MPNEQGYAPQYGRPPGSDPATQATDDDYELRRARTPVPGFLAEVVETHLFEDLQAGGWPRGTGRDRRMVGGRGRQGDDH